MWGPGGDTGEAEGPVAPRALPRPTLWACGSMPGACRDLDHRSRDKQHLLPAGLWRGLGLEEAPQSFLREA